MVALFIPANALCQNMVGTAKDTTVHAIQIVPLDRDQQYGVSRFTVIVRQERLPCHRRVNPLLDEPPLNRDVLPADRRVTVLRRSAYGVAVRKSMAVASRAGRLARSLMLNPDHIDHRVRPSQFPIQETVPSQQTEGWHQTHRRPRRQKAGDQTARAQTRAKGSR